MKFKIFYLTILALFYSQFSFGMTEKNYLQKNTSLAQLKGSLILDKSWVKYPAYTDRVAMDKFMGEYKDFFIKRGEKKLNYTWKVIKATDYLEYHRSGNRDIMQSPYFSNTNTMVELLLAELAEGKGRFIDQLMNMAFSAFEMTSWALSAHLSLQKNYKKFPMPDDFAVELVSGDVGSILSWTYYFLKDEFDKHEPMISKRIYDEVFRRIINPFMENDHYWWLGFNLPSDRVINNWNPWCNSNVLQCLMLLENNPDKLANGVYRTMLSVDKYLNFNNVDGACDEGPSYWPHAAGKLYDYLSLLKSATNGKTDIFDIAMIRNMGEYISRSYVGDNWVVNFADASARNKPDFNLIYRYGKAVNSKEMMEFASFLKARNGDARSTGEGRDILRYLENLEYQNELKTIRPNHQSPAYTWYPETQFCYLNGKEMFVALKGGHNNESHNHNDAGTFSLWIDNEPFIIDVGVGTYTRQTFSNERYNIWTMQSQYHNLPMIDGKAQVFGKENKATNVKFDPKKSVFSLDIHTAYPELNKNSSWNRKYQLSGKTLFIKDQFKLVNPQIPNQIHFLARGKITHTPGKIVIENNGKMGQLEYDKSKFNLRIEQIQLSDKKLSTVWGNEIFQIQLTSKNLKSTDSYEYKISKL